MSLEMVSPCVGSYCHRHLASPEGDRIMSACQLRCYDAIVNRNMDQGEQIVQVVGAHRNCQVGCEQPSTS
jgi:hypothetical protein